MKNFYTRVFVLCSFVISSSIRAQQVSLFREPDKNLPKIFQQLPDTLIFQPEKFIELLERKIGEQVQLSISNDARMQMNGQLVSSVSKYDDQIQSVVFRTDTEEPMLIIISKIRSEKGDLTYRGYIRGKSSADLYVLTNVKDGWRWVKKSFYDVINE